MADWTAKEILDKVRLGESLERADLRHIVLSDSKLEQANLRRADLEGANLEGSNLKEAQLTSANLRDAFLAGANLRGASLQKTDLQGANLDRADLREADLGRANLEGAHLERAKLDGAYLNSAQLALANLGGADLGGADLSKADLREAYLGGASLAKGNLRYAHLEKANLEEADLTGADLTEANLRGAYLRRTMLREAIASGAILDEATLVDADLSYADLRGASLRGANIDGLMMTGAKVGWLTIEPEALAQVKAEWVKFSGRDGFVRVEGKDLVEHYVRVRSASYGGSEAGPANRRFGRGDVLRNAALEFGSESVVEVQSRFENCSIALVEGARIMIGEEGVLDGCRIAGPGEIVVNGKFVQENGKASIVGARSLVVEKTGTVCGVVEQHADLTRFAFARGCVLRMNVMRHGGPASAGGSHVGR